MLLRVYVHTPEDFERWSNEQKAIAAGDPAVAAGRLVFERTACINCHALNRTVGDGRFFGPDLTHLMSRDTLASGALKNSPENLHAWIKSEPVQTRRPDAGDESDRTELDQLVATCRRSNEWFIGTEFDDRIDRRADQDSL
jgi:mono/diheme cytochrome c family protein